MIGPAVDGQATQPPVAAAADGYAGYEAWKGWTSYFAFDREEAEYFAGELRGIPLAGRSVLEIGFGTGSFLAWARAQGASVAGAEINERSLAEAARAGAFSAGATLAALRGSYDPGADATFRGGVFR